MAAVPAPRVCGGSTRWVDDFGLFSGLPQSHIAVMAKTPEVPKKSKTPKSKAPNPRPTDRTCSRSLRRWPNCSIPRSTAAMPAWARAPACSRRRTIRGTAAPAARRRRTARAPRPREPAKTSPNAMSCLLRPEVWKKPPRPITARRRPSPRSTPNSRANSACPRRKTTTRRWPGRRAARWKRSASRPPPMRWRI